MDNESKEVAVEQENTQILGISGVGRTAKLTLASLPTRNMAVGVETPQLSSSPSPSSHSNTTTALTDLTALLCSAHLSLISKHHIPS